MISHVLNGFGEDLINTDFGEYCPNYESADFNYCLYDYFKKQNTIVLIFECYLK